MKLIILDRDGVINEDRDDFVKSTLEWIPLPKSIEAIANLTQNSWKVVIATNQSGIGRGFFNMATLNQMHEKMHRLVNRAGGRIDAISICPHTNDDQCDCRKPKPGMIEDILERFNVPAAEVPLIGDSLRDLQAISVLGGQPILVLTGKGQKTLAAGNLPEGTLVFDNLYQAVTHLIQQTSQEDS
jgi:D-glycero-D-manno-heptose 1,7-bisphosphate phosphatase